MAIRMASDQSYAVKTKELEMRIAELQKDFDSSVAEATRLQGELANSRNGQEDIRARIGSVACNTLIDTLRAHNSFKYFSR